MIKKKKPCKGKGIAKGYDDACGTETYYYDTTTGLCASCLFDWMNNTETGKVYRETQFQKKIEKQSKKRNREEKKQAKYKLKTKSDYERELQKHINTIVRLIDKGGCCISTQKPLNAKYDAGHFYAVGSNPALRFNLFNIYAQSVYANQYLSGDQINFLSGLRHFYGSEHGEYVLSLKSLYKALKLSVDEIIEAIKVAKCIVKELQEANGIYDADERIRLRKEYNDKIGIYGE